MEQQIRENDIVLQQMATYNFNKPIEVTVLFDDIETESNTSLRDLTQNYNKNIYPPTQTLPRNELELLRNWVSSNICLNKMDNIYNSVCETNKDILKSNVINPQYNHVPVNNVSYQNGPVYNSQSNESFLAGSTTRINTNVCYPQHNLNASTTKNTDAQKALILHEIDNVSYNLIEISKCYYYNFIKQHENRATYDKALAHCRNFKEKHFSFSYCTVKCFMLPLENSPNFIEKYINRTIALAFKRSWHFITRDFLIAVIKELFDYVKVKLTMESNMQSGNPTNKENNLICLLSCGPKDREIQISVEPNVLNASRQNLGSNIQTEMTTHLPNTSNSYTAQNTFYQNHLPFHEREVINLNSNDVNEYHFAQSRSSVSRDSGFNSPVLTGVMCSENQMGYEKDVFTTTSSTQTSSMNRSYPRPTPNLLTKTFSNSYSSDCQRRD